MSVHSRSMASRFSTGDVNTDQVVGIAHLQSKRSSRRGYRANASNEEDGKKEGRERFGLDVSRIEELPGALGCG